MPTTTDLLARNAARTGTYAAADATIVPSTKAVVLACSDSRVDPAHFLDLDIGEALVIRNAGGRVTNDVIDEIVMLNAMMGMQRDEAPGVEVIVVHHTNCGAQRLADPNVREMLANATGIPVEKAEALAFTDPTISVQDDAAKLRASDRLPDAVPIHAYVFDVTTGKLAVVN